MEQRNDLSGLQEGKANDTTSQSRWTNSLYAQLPVDKSRTRVLIIHSDSSEDGPVCCSLEVIDLEPQPSRAYTALSYVWGEASVTEDITVNGVPFAVTSNLALALRHVRKNFGEVCLWADAICINQQDIPERNQQVVLMKALYSKAERVIGWLGPDDHEGARALKTFDALIQSVTNYPNNFEWTRKMPELYTMKKPFRHTDGTPFLSNDRMEELLLLLRRPFWRRIWIVQELVLPLNLRLLCGEQFMDMPDPDTFLNAINKLTRLPAGRPTAFPFAAWFRLNEGVTMFRLIARLRLRLPGAKSMLTGDWEGFPGFVNVRILLERHSASDPRDHIYGLLGILDLDITPDYGDGKTVADIYVQVARRCLKLEPINILSLAGTGPGDNTTQDGKTLESLAQLGQPSWVPDWRFPSPARIRQQRYPKSHAFPSADGLQMQVFNDQWLQGPAVVWDTISRTEHRTGWDLTEWDLVKDVDIQKDDDVFYPSGISRFQAFVILWIGGYDASTSTLADLHIDSALFRSYATIFLANFAQLWANQYDRGDIPKLSSLLLGSIKPHPSVPYSHREDYVRRSRQLRYDMRCFHTEKGYVGLGPLSAKVGDLICILEGHKAPVILRRRDSHYIFIGDCDVVGIMNGEVLEAVKQNEAEISPIVIR